ncbi:MAG: NAD(P)-dependent oxidoreductase, partial [Ignavibacteriaceae bacterium]
LFGFGIGNKKTHFHQMYENFENNNPVKLFYDQYRTPLSFFEAGRIINKLTGSELKGEIINLGGKERVSRLEMGEVLCNLTGFDKNLIEKVSMGDLPDYPAVEDVSMDTSKLQSYGIKLKSIEESVKEIITS